MRVEIGRPAELCQRERAHPSQHDKPVVSLAFALDQQCVQDEDSQRDARHSSGGGLCQRKREHTERNAQSRKHALALLRQGCIQNVRKQQRKRRIGVEVRIGFRIARERQDQQNEPRGQHRRNLPPLQVGKSRREQHEKQQIMRNVNNRFGKNGRRAYEKILKQTDGGRVLGKRRTRAGDVAKCVAKVHVLDHEAPVRQRVPLRNNAPDRKENAKDQPAAEHGEAGREHQFAKRQAAVQPARHEKDKSRRRENVDTDHPGIQRSGKPEAI
ncbi:hypothetical protein SDC9_150275 [bioreactor metagenome]|uniref:Uncharacterized protein n=1 Tax=bioreactor metagenome TaxID=1076179 RepID=A0A645EP55_9ZZZZ